MDTFMLLNLDKIRWKLLWKDAMQRRAHRKHFTYLMRCVEEKLVMLLLVAICISIARAERFDTTLACGKFKQMWGNHRHAGWKKRCFWRSYSRVIYVAGGLRNGEKLETCEMYDATANEWQLITRLNVPHYHGCMVCLNGKLFVLCGRNERN